MDTYAQKTAQKDGKDRRYLPRWETDLPASWKKMNGNRVREGVVKSLGCGGACLSGDTVFAPNESILLTIKLSRQTSSIQIKGTVRWVGEKDDQKVAGIYFLNMEDTVQDQILHQALREENIVLRDYMFKEWK